MNIFKVLSSNDGTINEPNVSSFLAYLLDPTENHGLGSVFLELFLKRLVQLHPENYKDIMYIGDVRDLSRNSNIEVRVEAEVKLPILDDGIKRKTRDIDILIELFDKTTPQKLLHVFAIENKINEGAIVKGNRQLNDEVVGLLNYYENDRTAISFIYLTPSYSSRALEEFEQLQHFINEQKYAIPAYHITWGIEKAEENNTAISTLIAQLLQEEAIGKIEPMYDYTKHTLKSFVSFIYSSFKSYQEEKIISRQKTDYGQPFIKYVQDFYNAVEFDVDIQHNELKQWVTERILKESGHHVKEANFDKSYIVNYPSRQHYSVNSPYKNEKNLFYFPDETNRMTFRKLDISNPPENIYIYWKDREGENTLAKVLLTTIFPDDKR